jgi:hypothetical protein
MGSKSVKEFKFFIDIPQFLGRILANWNEGKLFNKLHFLAMNV